jgi:hypothetical protein
MSDLFGIANRWAQSQALLPILAELPPASRLNQKHRQINGDCPPGTIRNPPAK